ncbi:hypothetical protein DFH28DRAFT_1177831 [Melampsora americana]|nr:hypothetical protein DFH28DRAFT_1177831 [Melampsora americana]
MNLNLIMSSQQNDPRRPASNSQIRLPPIGSLTQVQGPNNAHRMTIDPWTMNAHHMMPVRPSSACPSLSSNNTNLKMDENSMTRMRDNLRRSGQSFQSNPMLLEGNQNQITGRPFNHHQFAFHQHQARIDALREFVKRNDQMRLTHSASVHPRASTSSKNDEVRSAAVSKIVDRTHLRLAHSSSAQPQASTPSNPYLSRPSPLKEMIPSNARARLTPGQVFGPVGPNVDSFWNKEKFANEHDVEALIKAIQQVILVCRDKACQCQRADPETGALPQEIYAVITNDLTALSDYIPMPIVIRRSEITHGKEVMCVENRFKAGAPSPPPGSAYFDVYHGYVQYLVIEGLKLDVVPYLIAYFNSPVRTPISSQIQSTGIRFYVTDFMTDKR